MVVRGCLGLRRGVRRSRACRNGCDFTARAIHFQDGIGWRVQARCGIHDGIRIGEQLRDIIGFRTIVFGSGKRNQALRSGFMTIADVKRRMTEGTRGEHLHRAPNLSHGCKRIRVDVKRVNAIAS